MRIVIILVVILVLMQAVGWWAYEASQKSGTSPLGEADIEVVKDKQGNTQASSDDFEAADLGEVTYPIIQLETVGGVVERTIHMGVRQWAWDPFVLEANLGEKVRLVIHNADVLHSIEIPELGVSEAIPEEGAVVEFMADRRGEFEYSCGAAHCGKDHDKMRGKITIE